MRVLSDEPTLKSFGSVAIRTGFLALPAKSPESLSAKVRDVSLYLAAALVHLDWAY
jgi:hypothetical protein